jgi:hypothetical protein
MDNKPQVQVNLSLQPSLVREETAHGIGSKTDLVKRFPSLLPPNFGNEFRMISPIGTTNVEFVPRRSPGKPKFGLVPPAGPLSIWNVLTNGGILL